MVKTAADLEHAWHYGLEGSRGDIQELIIEEFIHFDSEITLLTVTQKNGPTLFCPPIGHVQKGGDYRESFQPAHIAPDDTGMVTLAGTQNFNEFELHLRAVLGLPIPCIKQMRIGASAVILSPIESQEPPRYKGLEETCEEDADVRIFGKPTTRVNRRMGVVVCNAPLDADLNQLRDKAKRLAACVEVY